MHVADIRGAMGTIAVGDTAPRKKMSTRRCPLGGATHTHRSAPAAEDTVPLPHDRNTLMDDRILDPPKVLALAVAQLRADRHPVLADDLEQVASYLRQLAATHTEITQASDTLLQHTAELLRRSPERTPRPNTTPDGP